MVSAAWACAAIGRAFGARCAAHVNRGRQARRRGASCGSRPRQDGVRHVVKVHSGNGQPAACGVWSQADCLPGRWPSPRRNASARWQAALSLRPARLVERNVDAMRGDGRAAWQEMPGPHLLRRAGPSALLICQARGFPAGTLV